MRVPCSTYRLQLNSSFGFKAALEILDYLDSLGITEVYASPILKARKGTLHGYDTVDPDSLNPEIGTEEEFHELMAGLKRRRMGLLLDIVSNHMAYDGANRMLTDVFEKGRASRYAGFFDIEWDHRYEGIKGRVLAPFLGRIYGEALEAGEIRLAYGATGLSANYYGFSFPLRIESYADFFTSEIKRLKKKAGRDHPDFIKFLGSLYVLKNLPSEADPDEFQDQITFIKRILWELYTKNPDIREFIDGNLASFNGRPGEPESFNLLDKILSAQSFKFSFWKVAAEEINYRRFFNINELITLRMEDEDVFKGTHSLVLRIIKDFDAGVRVDHIDGLYDPLEYLKRLKEKAGDVYMAVEKILARDEDLPEAWPVEGTTGYDFLNALNGVFCDWRNEARFTRIYAAFSGVKALYSDLFYQKKKLVTVMDMAGDVRNLAWLLKITLSKDRFGSDITLLGLRRAITEVMANLRVYRTYISPGSFTDADRARVKDAVEKAVKRTPALLNELNFIGRVLTLEFRDYFTEEQKKEWLGFVMRLQQFTGPLMAKGCEDTLLYVYNRLLSLNEVGGDAGRFGHPAQYFHSFNKNRAEKKPHSMNATSTHDTKRGEDARARINVLSEMPSEWAERIKRWNSLNKFGKRPVNGRLAPDKNDEYFLYQSLIGSYPFREEEYDGFRERLKQYIIKAVREAKIHTAWLKPDIDYEEAFISFVDGILDEGHGFLKDFLPFQRKVAWYGILNSLSQTLVKITSPGFPDFYQGTELWDFSFVDPDNRRPVNFGKRKEMLEGMKDAAPQELIPALLAAPFDGRVKLFLIHSALKARCNVSDLFYRGAYLPLEVKGTLSRHILAFAREGKQAGAVTIAPRLLASVINEGEYPLGEEVWKDTEVLLPQGLSSLMWKNVFTGETLKNRTLPAGWALNGFPVALLVSA